MFSGCIDGHLHNSFNGFDTKSLLEHLDRSGSYVGWILSWEEEAPEVPMLYQNVGLKDVLRCCRLYPKKFQPFYAPDPLSPSAIEDFSKAVDRGIKGCGELKSVVTWDDVRVERLLELVSQEHMPLIFHMEKANTVCLPRSDGLFARLLVKLVKRNNYQYEYEHTKRQSFVQAVLRRYIFTVRTSGYMRGFRSLERRLKEFDRIGFIGHGPLFWQGVSDDWDRVEQYPSTPITNEGPSIRLLKNYSNMYADISGYSGYNALKRDIDFTKFLLNRYYKKIIFGTDNCSYGYKKLILDVVPEYKKRLCIFRNNALSLLRG